MTSGVGGGVVAMDERGWGGGVLWLDEEGIVVFHTCVDREWERLRPMAIVWFNERWEFVGLSLLTYGPC